MLIRVQCKKGFVNVDAFQTIGMAMLKNEKIAVSIRFGTDTELKLGEYSSEEKAIKVLDMICEKYKEPIVRANYTDNESLIYANSVFQMPQDSEVET